MEFGQKRPAAAAALQGFLKLKKKVGVKLPKSHYLNLYNLTFMIQIIYNVKYNANVCSC
jgi:hypothetical protein